MTNQFAPRVRPSWDEYFMSICRVVATRSHDHDTQVGSVIVNRNRRIVSTGYNGLPAGVQDDFWATQRDQKVVIPGVMVKSLAYEVDKYDTVTHAEANAIVSATDSLRDCIMYSTLHPCNECAKLIITAGIKKIYYETNREAKSWAIAKVLFEQAGVETVQLKKKE